MNGKMYFEWAQQRNLFFMLVIFYIRKSYLRNSQIDCSKWKNDGIIYLADYLQRPHTIYFFIYLNSLLILSL